MAANHLLAAAADNRRRRRRRSSEVPFRTQRRTSVLSSSSLSVLPALHIAARRHQAPGAGPPQELDLEWAAGQSEADVLAALRELLAGPQLLHEHVSVALTPGGAQSPFLGVVAAAAFGAPEVRLALEVQTTRARLTGIEVRGAAAVLALLCWRCSVVMACFLPEVPAGSGAVRQQPRLQPLEAPPSIKNACLPPPVLPPRSPAAAHLGRHPAQHLAGPGAVERSGRDVRQPAALRGRGGGGRAGRRARAVALCRAARAQPVAQRAGRAAALGGPPHPAAGGGSRGRGA